MKVYADGDLRVAFGGQTWTFNPACLSAQPMEVDANLMTAENPNESGSKASCRDEGASSLTLQCQLYHLHAFIHPPPALPSSFVSATHCFHTHRLQLWPQSQPFCLFFMIVLHQVSFLEMFFSIECHGVACSQREALAAQQTFVIMSDILRSLVIMTKSILCMCSPQRMAS